MGEIAFQLDRRILAYVFPGVTRLYGFTVSNIPEKIRQVRLPGMVPRLVLASPNPWLFSRACSLPAPQCPLGLGRARPVAGGVAECGRAGPLCLSLNGRTSSGFRCPQTSVKSLDGTVDEKKLRELTHRYLTLTARLEKLGYNRDVHPVFSEFLINTYGILKQRPDLRTSPLHSSPAALRRLVIDVVPPKFLGDSLLLLNCLCELSKEDSKPLFAW